ncbi:hypothetical protein GCM10007941_05750 [Amphritea balenae]|nr:hypothetical protein GCM10007941_05750 [Amphritea balenae]
MTEGEEWAYLILKLSLRLVIIVTAFALTVGALPYIIFAVVMWDLVKSNK